MATATDTWMKTLGYIPSSSSGTSKTSANMPLTMGAVQDTAKNNLGHYLDKEGANYWLNNATGSNLSTALVNAVTPENKALWDTGKITSSWDPITETWGSSGGSPGGGQSQTPYSNLATNNTITMPSNSNPNAQGWTDALAAGIPEYFAALEGYKKLPGQIDEWTQNALNRQRMTGDQVSDIMNRVGNQRAGTGIMGGTENTNLTAETIAQLAKIFNDNQTNIEQTANTMKAQAISGLPGQAMMPINAMTSLYGTNSADQQSWAQIAANLLNTGY